MASSDFPETRAEAVAPEPPELDRFAMERVVLFSDAVYAIIITLLALDVRLPEHVTSADLGARLLEAVPKLGAYALSFLVVATLWRVHLRRFRHLVGIDSKLISSNMLQLMVTGLLPFSTSVLNAHLGPLAVTLYAVNIIAISMISWLGWWHVRRQPALVHPQLTSRFLREDDRRTWITVGVFAVSIPIAWWNPTWGAASWLLLLAGNGFLSALERYGRPPDGEE